MTSIPEMCLYAILATGLGLGVRKAFETLRPAVVSMREMHPDLKRLCARNFNENPKKMTINGNKSDPDISPEEIGKSEQNQVYTPEKITIGGVNSSLKDAKKISYKSVKYSPEAIKDIKHALDTVAKKVKIELSTNSIVSITLQRGDDVEKKLQRFGSDIFGVCFNKALFFNIYLEIND